MLVSCRVNCNYYYFYGTEMESLNAQILRLRAHFYVWQQVRQLLLFLPNIALEAILECLRSKIIQLRLWLIITEEVTYIA